MWQPAHLAATTQPHHSATPLSSDHPAATTQQPHSAATTQQPPSVMPRRHCCTWATVLPVSSLLCMVPVSAAGASADRPLHCWPIPVELYPVYPVSALESAAVRRLVMPASSVDANAPPPAAANAPRAAAARLGLAAGLV